MRVTAAGTADRLHKVNLEQPIRTNPRNHFVVGSAHALKSGMDVKVYADSVGRKQQTVSDEVCAARVAAAIPDVRYDVVSHGVLVAIHAAPRWLWPELCSPFEHTWPSNFLLAGENFSASEEPSRGIAPPNPVSGCNVARDLGKRRPSDGRARLPG